LDYISGIPNKSALNKYFENLQKINWFSFKIYTNASVNISLVDVEHGGREIYFSEISKKDYNIIVALLIEECGKVFELKDYLHGLCLQ